jgi:hypothetical protein
MLFGKVVTHSSEVFIMQHPKCDVCGQTAPIHDTKIVGGHVVTLHLCQEHGEAAWREAMLPLWNTTVEPGALADLEEHWRRLSVAEKEQLAQFHRLSRRCR